MNDKRTVSTDALETIGTLIESGGRDAIHLAVEPTVAAEKLYPGQDVGVDGSRNNPVGIVDPFLKQPVLPGERFWLVVYPRQINSLRHVWTHPAFPNESRVEVTGNADLSEKWLREFAGTHDVPSYECIVEAAKRDFKQDGKEYGIYDEGDYLSSRGPDAHCDLPSEFWEHLQVVVGHKFENRPMYFSCSC